jgi:hypothetical protein
VAEGENPYEVEIALVDDLKPGDVAVFACGGPTDRIAPWGELLSTAASYRGSVGCVTDGLVRDVRQIRTMNFPVFHGGNPSGGGVPTGPGTNRPFVAGFTRAPLLLNLTGPDGLPLVVAVPRESFAISMNGRVVESDTLLRPELLVVSGEEHVVFSGDNVPVRVAQTTPVEVEGGGDTFGQVRQDIERYDVGTSLRVTPTVGAEGGVTLELRVEASTLEESQAGDVDVVGPSIREIEIESTVRLRHGEVAAIASYTQPIVTRSETGIPWLKDIPILGFAFRATTDQAMKRYLLVSVQAEILRPEARELARALAEQLGPLPPGSRDLRAPQN